jgi:hypothetical protein
VESKKGAGSLDDRVRETIALVRRLLADGQIEAAAESLAAVDDSTFSTLSPDVHDELVAVCAEAMAAEARSLGYEPADYVRAMLQQRYKDAINAAMADRAEGLAAMDELLSLLDEYVDVVGAEDIASMRAALGYQRSAALRELGRYDGASVGYARTVSDHLNSDDETVGYWVALCMVNHAQMLMGLPQALDHPATAARILALVDQLFQKFGDSGNRDIRIRLGRAARLKVETLIDLNRLEEASAAYLELDAVLAHDDDEVRQEFAELAVVVSQASTGELSEQFLSMYALQFVEGAMADFAGTQDLAQLCFQIPQLLTDRVERGLMRLRAAAAPPQRKQLDRELRAIRKLKRHERSHRLQGDGPFEQLVAGIDVLYSAETACELARRPSFVSALAFPYVEALCGANYWELDKGNWRLALPTTQVIKSAIDRLPSSDEKVMMQRTCGLALLDAARAAWVDVPDPRVLRLAVDMCEELLAIASRYDHPVLAALAHESLGLLYLRPYTFGGRVPFDQPDGAIVLSGVRRWMDRLSEEVTDPGFDPQASEWQIPSLDKALDEAEKHLRLAVGAFSGHRAGVTLTALVDVEMVRRSIGVEIDHERVAEECATALRLLAKDLTLDPDVAITGLSHLERLGRQIGAGDVESVLGRSSANLRKRNGDQAVLRMLQPTCRLLQRLDPERCLRFLDENRDLVASADEDTRFVLLNTEWHLLTTPKVNVPHSVYTDASLEEVIGDMDRAAAQERWTEADRDRVVLIAARRRLLPYYSGLDQDDQAMFDVWTRAAARFGDDERADAAIAALTRVVADLGDRAVMREDWASACHWMITSCWLFLDLRCRDSATESLTLVEHAALQAEAGIGQPLLEALLPHAAAIDARLDVKAMRIMQRIFQRVLQLELRPAGGSAQLIVAYLQLAKGLRFAAGLSATRPYQWWADEQNRALLDSITQSTALLESSTVSHEESMEDKLRSYMLDDVTLVTAYDEKLDSFPSPSAADLLGNLQRTYDARVQRALVGDQLQYEPLFLNELNDVVPEDTLVLDLYHGRDPEGRPAIVWMMLGPGVPLTVGYQPIALAHERLIVGTKGQQRSLDELAAWVWQLRYLIQEEPGGRALVSEASQMLGDTLEFLLGPGVEHLRDRVSGGKRHLCIVPHGPLHFLPFHLLHLDGTPLSDHLLVTTMPHLSMLRPRQAARRSVPCAAVGIDFAEVNPYRLPPLVDAPEEARQIADLFGVEPVVPTQATEAVILEALETCRMVHVATHGEHEVPAPLFQRLFAVPSDGDDGRLAAYELLARDFNGLELVTLSACETALGRFDIAGNLQGIPAALLARGAQALVGTLWEVETSVSRDFFVELYVHLRAGAARGDAFALAQRAVREGHRQYRDWGAFQYIGDWR